MGRIVGVLGLQGDFALHQRSLGSIGVSAPKVRHPRELDRCDGLIVPGGESTTFTKMLRETGLFDAIQAFVKTRPVMGTCAGLITLSTRITNDGMETLGIIDLEVERNAYGRQKDSFVAMVKVPALKRDPEFEGVFIRAPKIRSLGKGSEALAFHGDTVVMARNPNVLAMTFHPELTDDARIHRFFLEAFIGGA
jgi:5'-phosphate synthase pdxT subunit